LNDIHYDAAYQPTATLNTSCRVPLQYPNASYAFGQYGCDSPKLAILSLLNYASTLTPSPDYIFIAGDFVPHGGRYDRPAVLNILQTVIAMIVAAFPSTPIYSGLGNHDFYPEWGTVESDPGDFANFANILLWLSPSELATFLAGGYYYHDFQNIRILFLNSMMYGTARKHTGDPDPFGQFAWIESVATDAIAQGLSIGAVMHVPPGVQKYRDGPGWYPEYITRYHNLTLKYDFQFALCGHSHLDFFLPTEQAEDLRYVLSSIAVATGAGNNPGFRVYQIDEKGIVNYQQYYADILKNPTGDMPWKLEYDFKSAYGVDDVSPSSMVKAAMYARDDEAGKWLYQSRIYNQAIRNGGFYYCALTCTTPDEILDCQKTLAPDYQ
jgi:sphingomyelin phosphodiesterase acid-like 3